MNPAVKQLNSIMPPIPLPPVVAPPWIDIEHAMGVRLPTDYREFIDSYGDGQMNRSLSVFFPARRGPHRTSMAALSDRTAGLYASGFFDKFGIGDAEFARAKGKSAALLLWGQSKLGDLLFWSTDSEDADRWTVTVFLQETLEHRRWSHYDQGMAEFLVAVAERTIPESARLLGPAAGRARWSRLRDWGQYYG
ncbi:hypothetical protein [Nocardia sp. NPDC046763]|uniref:hypothetical protein n=1 Tax=Nocardia sp. NPDC046763 TaxID=3155256 RepID=UPI0033EFCC8C